MEEKRRQLLEMYDILLQQPHLMKGKLDGNDLLYLIQSMAIPDLKAKGHGDLSQIMKDHKVRLVLLFFIILWTLLWMRAWMI